MTTADCFSTNSEHVVAELGYLDLLLARAVKHAGTTEAVEVDPLRMAYVSSREVERLLEPAARNSEVDALELEAPIATARLELDACVSESLLRGVPLCLPRLARIFGLDVFEQRVLLLALAPEIELKYERIFAFLQDDLTRRRPSVDLALRLFDERSSPAAHALGPSSPLFRFGLLAQPSATEGPWLAAPLVLDDSVARFLLEGRVLHDEWFKAAHVGLDTQSLRWPSELTANLRELVHEHARAGAQRRLVCELVGPWGTGRKTLATALCSELGIPLAVVDARMLVRDPATAENHLRRAFRRALLAQAALYFEHFDCLLDADRQPLRDVFVRAVNESSWLVFLGSERPTEIRHRFPERTCVRVELAAPDVAMREGLWRALAAGNGRFADDVDCADLAARFRLTPGAMRSALRVAEDEARLRGPNQAISRSDLTRGCYAQSNSKLAALARRLPAKARWQDLVLPANTLAQLREICMHVRHRRRVYEDWGLDKCRAWGKGICALFHGPSGVGKTMGADVIAHELELDGYRIDLSAVVSKYIGETEKNLSRLFEEAETSNAILFFDEADALFGKRSEVKDAHDRYANIETNYLLQRIEEFDGLVILASNLRKNIDEGFFRRLQFAVEFPLPDRDHRYRIWRSHLPASVPLSAEVDLGFLAGRFAIAGGNIRNIVLNAAFLAADDGGTIEMSHLVRATRREYEKMGKLCTDAEFSPYHKLLQ